MTWTIHYAGRPDLWDAYRSALATALAARGIKAPVTQDGDPAKARHMIYAPNGPVSDFAPFTTLEAVHSLWAGVEGVIGRVPAHLPLTRMVDPGLTAGMVEYMTGHVLRHHLGTDALIAGQDGVWRNATAVPQLARDRVVGILGMGALGTAVATALLGLGFAVHGWSRTPRNVAGVTMHAGKAGLREILARAEIVVMLLPQTAETENTLNRDTIALMPKGACVINAGRGTAIDDDALLAALDAGHLDGATLDVFRVEPLPADHPYWHHARVLVTPHIAAETRVGTAAEAVAENIARGEAGKGYLNLVDRASGY